MPARSRRPARGRSRDRAGHRRHRRPSASLIVALRRRRVRRTAAGRIGLLRWASRRLRARRRPPRLGRRPRVRSALVSLLPALFGLVWDESLHIDHGRDAGPAGQPVALLPARRACSASSPRAGSSLVLPAARRAARAGGGAPRPRLARARSAGSWSPPAASFALDRLPARRRLAPPVRPGRDAVGDDPPVDAHRRCGLRGRHCSMLHRRGPSGDARAARRRATRRLARRVDAAGHAPRAARRSPPAGSSPALSIYQGEFDFGVPQFRLIFHPLMIVGRGVVALVAARMLGGRGAALGAVAFFLVVRSAYTLLVGPVLGESVAHFPLYLVEALIVEARRARARRRAHGRGRFALRRGGADRARSACSPSTPGRTCGCRSPWPSHMLPEAIAWSLPVALAGAVLGAFLAGAIRLRGRARRDPRGDRCGGSFDRRSSRSCSPFTSRPPRRTPSPA